jgi:signal peptidase II
MSRNNDRLSKRALAGICLISTGILLFLDQMTKHLAREYLAGQPAKVMLPGVLELRHLENRGVAFGMFEGKTGLFLILCLLFFAAAVYVFVRLPGKADYLPLYALLSLMAAGAAGNFVDRAMKGSVTDFIYFSLIDFPIFNLADIYVVSSGILLVILIIFKYKDEDFAFLNPHDKG